MVVLQFVGVRSYVTPIKYASNDRMIMLYRENLCPLYIIGVYLPHRSCVKDNIEDYLNEVMAFMESNIIGELIISETLTLMLVKVTMTEHGPPVHPTRY